MRTRRATTREAPVLEARGLCLAATCAIDGSPVLAPQGPLREAGRAALRAGAERLDDADEHGPWPVGPDDGGALAWGICADGLGDVVLAVLADGPLPQPLRAFASTLGPDGRIDSHLHVLDPAALRPDAADGGAQGFDAGVALADLPAYERAWTEAAALRASICRYRWTGPDGVARPVVEAGWPVPLPDGRILVVGAAFPDAPAPAPAPTPGEIASIYAGEGGLAVIAFAITDAGLVGLAVEGDLGTVLGLRGAGGPPSVEMLRLLAEPEDRPVLDAHLAALARGRADQAVCRIRGLDGVPRVIWSRAAPERDAAGRPTRGIAVLMRAEALLEEARTHPLDEPAAQPTPLRGQRGRVLQLATDGLSNGEIAERLDLSPATVRNHMAAVCAVLGATNRAEAITIARRRRVVR